ncbi:NAD(P)/FAD-dependent oxidoreductase [uncultured Microbacterium sp.]|uniref:2-polyprenyl-6-methoxyphenol hydroxylase n=1 Tax=uncultured Microbacterium sp. TaxID=191216 RepID=A0A1Y5P1K9_9MICO|nr:NAD(P)/FAD-dependent oxidoreductase [uncultured Microbacterium sp.]SBS72574.1 2-polyprenyl-6-methoxyphenol hydroxylase [uncultured Microbacterium sp.]
MPDVVVVGAGPVGTLLAAELTRRGVDVALLERRTERGPGSRAIGLHAPVLAALEDGGATDRILERAVRVRRGEARSDGRLLGVVRFDRLSARHPFVATLPQAETEAALAVGAPEPQRGVAVNGIRTEAALVRVTAAGGSELSAPLVVVAGGAGARGLVYRPGALRQTAYPDRYLMTDADVPGRADAEVAVVHLAPSGVLESFPLPGGRRRFVAWDGGGADDPAARLARLRAALADRGEADAVDATGSATAFGVRRIVAPRLRRGRVVVIGDAAHEVSPIGGQGMNLGLLDAATLAPLLALWLRTGREPEAELAAWERARVRSAGWAARLAALNTGLGRPRGAVGHVLREAALRAALGAAGPLAARGYAMGFDAAAR